MDHVPREEIASFLSRAPLFKDLDGASLDSLTQIVRLEELPKGYVLFIQGEPGDAAYLVYDGTIAISLNTLDGRELVINEMRAGDFFGELALFGAETRSASAIAKTLSRVIRIHRQAFLELLDCQPRMTRQLLETIAGRLRSSGQRESALAFLDAPERLARILIQRARLDSPSGDLVKISQEELAQYVGVSRQTVAKILGIWRRAGFIITGRGRIMLVDQRAIQQLFQEY